MTGPGFLLLLFFFFFKVRRWSMELKPYTWSLGKLPGCMICNTSFFSSILWLIAEYVWKIYYVQTDDLTEVFGEYSYKRISTRMLQWYSWHQITSHTRISLRLYSVSWLILAKQWTAWDFYSIVVSKAWPLFVLSFSFALALKVACLRSYNFLYDGGEQYACTTRWYSSLLRTFLLHSYHM